MLGNEDHYSENEFSDTPSFIHEEVTTTVANLLPRKSKHYYDKEYELFIE